VPQGAKGAKKSKLALLDSVQKMLEQQKRHMDGEGQQLTAVTEYLRLRKVAAY
jgi:hypothetical protein